MGLVAFDARTESSERKKEGTYLLEEGQHGEGLGVGECGCVGESGDHEELADARVWRGGERGQRQPGWDSRADSSPPALDGKLHAQDL